MKLDGGACVSDVVSEQRVGTLMLYSNPPSKSRSG